MIRIHKEISSYWKKINNQLLSIYLWELCDQMVGHLHGAVEEIKCLRKLPFIGCQHFWDGSNNVLNLIFLKAELYFTHLLKTITKST